MERILSLASWAIPDHGGDLPAAQARARAVRQAIFAAAIPLVLDRGYDAITVEEIADQAGVSRRTVFRYFPTKADIILDWAATEGAGLCISLAAQAADRPLLHRLRAALADLVACHRAEAQMHLAMGQLSAANPALRARAYEKFEIWEDMLCAQVARDHGRADASEDERLTVALFMTVYRQAIRQWVIGNGSQSIEALLDAAFARVPDLLDKEAMTGTSSPM